MTEEMRKLQEKGVRQFWNQVVDDLTGGREIKTKVMKKHYSKGRKCPKVGAQGYAHLGRLPVTFTCGANVRRAQRWRKRRVFVVKVFFFYVSLHFFVFDSDLVGVLCEAAF